MFKRTKHYSVDYRGLDENLTPYTILQKLENREPFKVDDYFSILSVTNEPNKKSLTSRTSLPNLKVSVSGSTLTSRRIIPDKKPKEN